MPSSILFSSFEDTIALITTNEELEHEMSFLVHRFPDNILSSEAERVTCPSNVPSHSPTPTPADPMSNGPIGSSQLRIQYDPLTSHGVGTILNPRSYTQVLQLRPDAQLPFERLFETTCYPEFPNSATDEDTFFYAHQAFWSPLGLHVVSAPPDGRTTISFASRREDADAELLGMVYAHFDGELSTSKFALSASGAYMVILGAGEAHFLRFVQDPLAIVDRVVEVPPKCGSSSHYVATTIDERLGVIYLLDGNGLLFAISYD